MSLDKKGFAEIIENAIKECKCISASRNNFTKNIYLDDSIEDDEEYKYNKYMEKLTMSKIKRLYSILSLPAYSRITTMTDNEIEEYRNDKVAELSASINRLMLAMEVSDDEEKINVKNKVELLVQEQDKLREMTCEEMKKHVIDLLNLDTFDNNESFDGKEENIVLQNIVKDKETMTHFLSMLGDYKKIEREIKEIRAEQIIIYNDLLSVGIKGDISIDELFSEESLSSLQSTLAKKITEICDFEMNLKKNFSSKTKKAYDKIKSHDYKLTKDVKILPYDKDALEIFAEIIPSKTIELANLQNDEWKRLNKKVFRTMDINNKIAILSMEIDETKKIIDSFIKDWYKNAYYNNSLFGPVSSRASGKFEYSLGAKNSLDEFINFGVWPSENDINSLKKCLKLNRIEAEKSVIYTEQIKERLTRLFNTSLDVKKKALEDLDETITAKFGNWKNKIILSIVNETK